MEIEVFNNRFFNMIETLDATNLEKIYSYLVEKGLCEQDMISDTDQKTAIKNGVNKVSIEDLESIDVQPLNELILEFKDTSSAYEFFEEQEDIDDIRKAGRVESKEELVQEATNIASQRLNDREEIPKDLQKRLAYILGKLNVSFKISKRELSKLINLNPATVTKYVADCLSTEPDLIKLWSNSAEAKTISKIETTLTRATSDRAAQNVKDSIAIADAIREKFAAKAWKHSEFNLYTSAGLSSLINKSLNLYFDIDSIYDAILDLENQNEKLRNNTHILTKKISYLNALVYERNFTDG